MTPSIPAPISTRLRDEALLILDGRGAIMDGAREVSRAFLGNGVAAAVIGGVAVVLHGYVRTTTDIDIFVPGPLGKAVSILEGLGFVRDQKRREFVREEIPVHLVTLDQLDIPPSSSREIEGIMTVSLPDLLAMKLRSGTKHMLRAIDLADVIGLIRANGLSGSFAGLLPKDVRPAYRKLIRAFDAESDRGS